MSARGDGHALKLAAGEFVGIASGHLPEAQSDLVQCLVHHRLRRGLAPGAKQTTCRCIQVAIHPLEGVEGFERVLEDRLDALQELSPGSAVSTFCIVLALEQDVAACRLFEAEDHARQRRLARPGLADDREDLGGVGRQREVGIDDGIDIAARELAAPDEALGDVRNLEQRGHWCTTTALSWEPIWESRRHVGAAPARRPVIQAHRLEWRHLGLALFDGQRASRVKAAASGRFGKVGRSSLERRFGRGVADAWQGGDQMGGVGMPWCGEERARRRLFHEPARIDDADAVGGVGVHAHVVGDEHHGRPHLALHLADHRQHVLLHHHVERRGRLVGDDELWLTHGGQGDRHPLAHPAGQLVRIGGQDVGRQTETLEVRFDPAPELTTGQPHRPKGEVLERPANPPHRIEQAHRSLHDVGKVFPAERVDLRLARRIGIDVAVLEVIGHRSADDSQRWTNCGCKRLDQRGLARGALAGDAIDLVLAN